MIRLLCLCVHRNMTVITPPHPTPSPERCLCLLESKKDDKVAVPVCAQEHERYYPTPPHPQKGAFCWRARKMKRFAVTVCAQEHERYYPTPPQSRECKSSVS